MWFAGIILLYIVLTLEIEDFFLNRNTPEYEEHEKFIKKLYKYKDRMQVVYFDTKDILRKTDLGLWIIRISDEDSYHELHADETMERIIQWTENTHLRNATITGLTG